MLTLASNERIPLRANMRMIFEIRDLKYATPATVSRAGILYVSTVEGQQWHSLIASWVTGSGYSEEEKTQLSGLFELYIPRAVQLLSTQMKTSVECEPTTAVSALLQVRVGPNTYCSSRMFVHQPGAYRLLDAQYTHVDMSTGLSFRSSSIQAFKSHS